MKITAVFLMLTLLFSFSSARNTSAQNAPSNVRFTWKRIDYPILRPQNLGFAVTLNPINQIALVFGGYGDPPTYVRRDLWLTNGKQWMEFPTPHQPPERIDPGMVYDENRQAALLYGGMDPKSMNFLDDTWLFNGIDWVEQLPQTSPSPRMEVGMAYDPERQRTYLFGGTNRIEGSSAPLLMNDTWVWDGAKWQELFPDAKPSPRRSAAMTYDPIHHYVLLFGGVGRGVSINETWTWDGSHWTELHPLHSPGNAYFEFSNMAFDPIHNHIVIVGEDFVFSHQFSTWTWDGQDWTELDVIQSPPWQMAVAGKMVYLPALGTVVLISTLNYPLSDPNIPTREWRMEVWALEEQRTNYLPTIFR